MPDFTVGVEEEFFIIDADTHQLRPSSDVILETVEEDAGGQLEHELRRSQVELGTAVCTDLSEVRAELQRLRAALADAAAQLGARLLASGTHPSAHWQDDPGVTPKVAYRGLERDFRQLTREQLICGCHVHVCVTDPEMAIQIMNRARLWLPVLVALSGNSPYWLGADTGYSSYRTEIFHRWPTAGIPEHFADRAAYDSLVHDMLATQSIDQPARLYWDLRPSARYDTLEFRATDVLTTVDEAVAMAALSRALVETCHRDIASGRPAERPRPELLRSALWRAARYGTADQLVDVHRPDIRPAGDVVHDLLSLVEPVLVERGEWAEVVATCERVLLDGNGAQRQRRAHAKRGDFDDVIEMLLEATSA